MESKYWAVVHSEGSMIYNTEQTGSSLDQLKPLSLCIYRSKTLADRVRRIFEEKYTKDCTVVPVDISTKITVTTTTVKEL